ncbi:deazaflavin-dependent oxidoreductase (nitroreductase family) [Micromonospora pisi]|uniref:Deazaflavin-dependent oxidoreductase (Nitroreductase family) n=1 Tax=Micromonospora pisi TaxID=589240 RepID=A0A495JRD7_9ACTN|nr:nitroreductase family deazaflavin-dependent oxidoreductase [Micromonospora pisi]RKR91560.1 deazaflavin-dependent oxidoreductase (nitroreductase family) [Micromonospora pisi]
MTAPGTEEVQDSPTGWVADHIREYVESNGERGRTWRGYPTLLITVRGRKSGKLHRTALIYGRDGDNYLLVASQGGAPKHPAWYLNLTADPEVRVEVDGKTLVARARTATPEEKPELWQRMVEIFPPYATYQTKTSRQIPVVILEPVD